MTMLILTIMISLCLAIAVTDDPYSKGKASAKRVLVVQSSSASLPHEDAPGFASLRLDRRRLSFGQAPVVRPGFARAQLGLLLLAHRQEGRK